MKRGEWVTVALQGDFGKPPPALIIQSDLFTPMGESVVVLLLSSGLIPAHRSSKQGEWVKNDWSGTSGQNCNGEKKQNWTGFRKNKQ